MSQQHQVRVTFGRCSFFEDLLCFLHSRLSFTIGLMVVGTCCYVIEPYSLANFWTLGLCTANHCPTQPHLESHIVPYVSSVSWWQWKPSGHTICRSQRNQRNNLRSPCNSCDLSRTGRWKFWPKGDLERHDWWASPSAVLCSRMHTFRTLRWNLYITLHIGPINCFSGAPQRRFYSLMTGVQCAMSEACAFEGS